MATQPKWFAVIRTRNTTDIDGDGNTTEVVCRNPDTYIVERSAALRGEKWIRSTDAENAQVVDMTTFLPDASCPNGGTAGLPGSTNPFTRYPCISQAFTEGALSAGQFSPPPPAINPELDDFEYNVRIFNDGNVPMLEYVLYDILPFVGDVGSGGTLYSSSRLSQFRPILDGPVQFLSGPAPLTAADFTIEYNDSVNPCRPEVFNLPSGAIPAGCSNTWSGTWSASARSYRIRLNAGSSIASTAEVRFGVPMHIAADAPPAGFDSDDALSHEIAWNSFSHVGSYDRDPTPALEIQDLLASEPRKVGITVPERMSVGNRIWRDADNSGTINPPDDTNPGIANVTVNLYRDADNNGVPDGPAISTTTTDTEGYYLFSNIPYDSAVPGNNRYIIGVPSSNFGVGAPLESLRSSTGTPATATYTAPTSNTVDRADDGIDPAVLGGEVFSWSFTLQPGTEPTAEADLSSNDRDGLPGQRRGVNDERDNNSDLTIDFGFFGGSDVPFSIGNHVWRDTGETATPGVYNFTERNDGIRQATEPPVAGALVRLYRDGNNNGVPDPAEMIRWDTTDANGFYLFDNLDPGPYFVEIDQSNFDAGGPLAGWYSSQVTGTENIGVPGNPNVPNMDSDDNGIDTDFPETDSVFSGVITLTRNVSEPTGETHLSGDTSSAPGFDPTAGDGPGSIGRFGETDATSNMTVDFGFIPPMSLGNRVWYDEGSGAASLRTDFNNGIQNTGEFGVNNVRVELWRDTNGTPGLQVTGGTPDTFLGFDTTDASGYYLFERLQPGNDYYVHIPASNFALGQPLRNYFSSTDATQPTPPADDMEDMDDNGIDAANPATTGVTSSQITMAYNTEPLTPANETDINNSGTYGPNNVGTLGQADGDSNLTIDFGFARRSRSLGNRLWIDTNNNGILDGGESPVPAGVRVSLYWDGNGNGIPDDLGVAGDYTDDAIGYDLTDPNGYYLFDHLPPANYIVGVDYTNFTGAGSLVGYTSSTGHVDNASNNLDSRDNGIDRLQIGNPTLSPYGVISTRIALSTAPTGETGSGDTSMLPGFNPTAGDGTNSRGRFGEADNNSDLTIDFGFFIPMSLGNRVFLDNGAGGGTYNNGIMDGGETPVAGARVELWRDADANGVPDAGGMLAFDTTDVNGYYLFDRLTPGSYVVVMPASNFTGAGPLVGYNTSTPTGTETVGVPSNPYLPNTDRDDNGLNVGSAPTVGGVRSGTITLAYGTEPTGEIELSGQADPGAPANVANSPTGWDGPTSRGRWEESDINSNLTIDFGFIQVFSLGNRVWFDTNNDSLMGVGEQGVSGVIVHLFASDGVTEIPVGPDGILNTADDSTSGVTTTANGYYLFNNLPAGDYVVALSADNFSGAGALFGYWSSGTALNGVGAISETLAALANSDTDLDDNGTLSSGRVISSVVTLGLATNSEPAGETDLDATLPGNRQGQPDGQANMTVDFGFYQVSVGDLVYFDNNMNGTYDAGDTTITPAVTVHLFAADGVTEILVGPDGVLGTADDSASGVATSGGVYEFAGLPQGQYIIRTTGPSGSYSTIDTFSAADSASPDANVNNNDNGVGVGTGTVSANIVTLTPGSAGATSANTVDNATGITHNPTVDFGFVNLVALGNRVWIDDGTGGGTANNGIIDGGEAGVANVTVELRNSSDDSLVATTTTDASGYYQFDMLYPGTYYVSIPATEFQPGGDLETYYSSQGNGTNETSDETVDENGIDDANPALNGIQSIDYTLTPGAEVTGEAQTNYTGVLDDANVNFTADFGFTHLYGLGNRLWFDTDNDSVMDVTEVGVGDGVVVNLYRASDLSTPIATDTTANGGYYLFDNLYPGDYVVSVDVSNFNAGGALEGYWSSATVNNNAGGITETTAALANTDIDRDDNGTLQTGGLLNGSVISSTVTLGPSGNTEPTSESDLEAGINQGSQADGHANMTVDFGFYTTTLGNLVWSDTDRDGSYNGAETGIDGVTVELWSQDGTTQLATTTTAGGGLYSFPGLPQGDYTVHVIAPPGSSSSVDNAPGGNDTSSPNLNIDNQDNGIGTVGGTVISNPVTLTPGAAQTVNTVDNTTGSTSNPSMDFGFTPVFSLGNRVWFDTNNNSAMDAGEQGVDGVYVQLFASDGVTEILVGPDGILGTADDASGGMLTANGGYYLFNNLLPGDYVVALPSNNFSGAGALTGYWSSATARDAAGTLAETTAALANTDTDRDDNGTLSGGRVVSSIVTLGPAVNSEPAGETDLDATLPGNQQGQPDTQANMTVDFGFYTITLGNLVWDDLDNSGTVNGAEAGIDNVTVQLFVADSAGNPVGAPYATATTAGGGLYSFTGLPQGNYIVRIPDSEFMGSGDLRDYYSSTGGGTEPAPSPDLNTSDNDDNGSEVGTLGFSGGYIQTEAFALTPSLEASVNNATGTTNEPRVDFGVFNAIRTDLSITKTDGTAYYVAGGTLTYTLVVTNNGPADVTGATVTDTFPLQIVSPTWTCATTGGATCGVSGVGDINDTVNMPVGSQITYTITAPVSLTAVGNLVNTATVAPPVGVVENDNTNNSATDTDAPAALTITKDDALTVVSPGSMLTYTITLQNTGAVNLTNITVTDPLPSDVTYQSASLPPNSAPPPATPGGTLVWNGISLNAGTSTSFTVTVQVNPTAAGADITNTITATDGPTTTTDSGTDIDILTLDKTKALIGTDQTFTPETPAALRPVAIGEILTYQITVDVPAGSTLTDLKALDILDAGLAFVRCVTVDPGSSGDLSTTLPGGFSDACNAPTNPTVAREPIGSPSATNDGRRMEFSLGDVTNANATTTRTLVITYEVIVLDISSNVDGVNTLNNQVTWSWTGGSLSASANPVEIVEPRLSIDKSASPTVASYGSPITFTLDIAHTPASSIDAFDVIATDILPAGLQYVVGSATTASGLAPTSINYNSGTGALTFVWDTFPLGASSRVTFQATFVGPAPVTNEANVAWTSLPIDPQPSGLPVILSDFNNDAHERWYDPAASASVDNYVASSAVTLTLPDALPRTGFAPGVVTDLPPMPAGFAYAQTDLWIEIPKLNLKLNIAGVPFDNKKKEWDLTWLNTEAGWLENTAFPTHSGNSALTAHTTLANGLPGPFAKLASLSYGDQIIIHLGGQKYIYEVRTTSRVRPNAVASVLKHEEYSWLTLITCNTYNEQTGDYTYRSVVRAVLVKVVDK